MPRLIHPDDYVSPAFTRAYESLALLFGTGRVIIAGLVPLAALVVIHPVVWVFQNTYYSTSALRVYCARFGPQYSPHCPGPIKPDFWASMGSLWGLWVFAGLLALLALSAPEVSWRFNRRAYRRWLADSESHFPQTRHLTVVPPPED